ncbi:MAG: ABC transporter permease subunit [Burkholderiales bacterium]|nr:ABC transporter permease subunit [Burkholderiales bacterium]
MRRRSGSAGVGGGAASRVRLSTGDPRLRALAYQAAALAAVIFVGWYLISNTLANLEARRIASGLGFLGREAGFAIGETSLVPYSAADTYLRAIVVGLANTFRVALIGIVAATVLGTLVGLARLSRNWLVAKLAAGYVEFVRNVPLLVQLFFWYAVITENLPVPREAVEPLPGVFLVNRGIFFPVPAWSAVHGWMLAAFAGGVFAAVAYAWWARRRQARTGRRPPVLAGAAALLLLPPAIVWLAGGAPARLSVPELAGFNFAGGAHLSPEFAALAAGLIVYTASFIAEIVRAGVLSVHHGQFEAASALGLRRGLALRLVVLPQALRAIVPPITSQYLNLTKNSSLAVAIGYPDLVSIANTTINQTGQAIEGIAIIMAVYLTISLAISALMNWYNARIALTER